MKGIPLSGMGREPGAAQADREIRWWVDKWERGGSTTAQAYPAMTMCGSIERWSVNGGMSLAPNWCSSKQYWLPRIPSVLYC